MTHGATNGPVLFCYDGSEGSRGALRAAGHLIDPSGDAVVLTVWEPIAVRMALAGAFAATSLPSEGDFDEQEESFARAAAQDGTQRAVEHGFTATALTRESTEGIPRAIISAADELSARLIVCGQRGRSPMRAALLGSVSHALAAHARRPVLVAPE